MPGSTTAIRQERLKKAGVRPNTPVLFTINEEDEQQKNGNSKKQKVSESSKLQDKKAASSSRPSSAALGLNTNNTGARPDSAPVLKVDERQRLARERRVEREKVLAARELAWIEKEERARQYYEKHLEERKKKLEEQRLKEERRRAAVEEKRRQRLEEDKERHEAVVRRTIERSQKPKQKQNRWSWGGTLHSNSSINTTARRLQLSPWESSVVSRLLTPTHSFLARSKSAATLSGDAASCSPISPLSFKAISCRNPADRAKLFGTTPDVRRRRTTHSAGTNRKEKEKGLSVTNLSSGKKRARSPSAFRSKSSAWHASRSLPFLPGTPRKLTSPQVSSRTSSAQPRPPSPGNIRPVKNERKLENEKKDTRREPEKIMEEKKDQGKATPAPSIVANENLPCNQETTQIAPTVLPSAPSAPSAGLLSPVSSKPSAGTTDPEEATRLLSEKRRLAREQREREEQQRREKEETERQKKEELAQKIAEERARREEEAQKLEAERKQRETEQEQEKEEQLRLHRLAEEKEQKDREEMEQLQKQKEEEMRLREEQIRVEREKHFQREEQERLERKKRLEEIMRRTRRTEAAEKKSNEQQNGEITKERASSPTSPLSPIMGSQVQHVPESPRNGEVVTHTHVLISHEPTVNLDSNLNPGKHPNENGVTMQNENFEELINLPMGTKTSRLDAMNNEEKESAAIPLTPILAFEEKGTLGPLPQVDNVQTHQTAEVV
ncbi:ensconsin isoform X8 [Anolis carolinensis]|uniref:ensconsin isoform X8 n=1 Tax=Anolis carolinensis TaxID=28377 RepID=UPI000462B7F3|nr:PREDICTED: ensconsin isoform X5 [Anolis carolinensis]|eukprot:XP_008112726.1 PREDICTED: ensconsin isoform X5 [Anolis carolinensis]